LPVNIYEMSSWTRAIVIPLTILYGLKPCWPVPPHARIDELFSPSPAGRGRRGSKRAGAPGEGLNWRSFFLILDRALRLYDRCPVKPGRQRALHRATRWMVDHIDHSEGLAAI